MPNARLAAIKKLSSAGVPVGVSAAPMIPGLNDHEIPAILEAAADHGARAAFYTVVRLPYGVADVFKAWLEDHRPGEEEKILGRIREMRGGKLYESRFGSRMRGEGAIATEIETLFRVSAQRFGLDNIVGTPTIIVTNTQGDVLNFDTAPTWRNAASRSEDEVFEYFSQLAIQ